MKIECDVLVVGAGPAGSVAALYCSKHGLNTILIERNSKVGAHTNTKIDSSPDFGLSEIITELGLKTENLVYKSKWYSPSGGSFTLHSNVGEYYFKRGLDPDSFECSTVSEAVKHSCKLFLSTEVKKINKNDGMIDEVVVLQGKNKIVIEPKIIIAADGSNSIFHKYIEKRPNSKKVLGYGVTGKNFTKTDTSEIYFNADLIPKGYFYCVTCPSGISSAAVFKPNKRGKSPEECFNLYMSQRPDISIKIKSNENTFSGQVSLFQLDRYVNDNLIFVGESGGLIDPLMGYGMLPAIISAYYAGKYSTDAVKKNDYATLKKYDEKIKQKFNKRSAYWYRKIFDSFNNKDIDLIIKMANEMGNETVNALTHHPGIKDLLRASLVFFKNIPKSALLLSKGIYSILVR